MWTNHQHGEDHEKGHIWMLPKAVRAGSQRRAPSRGHLKIPAEITERGCLKIGSLYKTKSSDLSVILGKSELLF